MKVVIDTCSLLSLERYYLRFDTNDKLFDFIKKQIENGEIIIIDEVLKECEYTAKGIVVKKLNYLKDREFKKEYKVPFKTEFVTPPRPKKFLNQVDNQFINGVARRKLTDIEYESEKKRFLASADARMIICCLNLKKGLEIEKIILVTEETEGSNDQKSFKKIPDICQMLDIEVLTLPEILEQYEDIDVQIK